MQGTGEAEAELGLHDTPTCVQGPHKHNTSTWSTKEGGWSDEKIKLQGDERGPGRF